tara:strand:- start:3112 stop:3306 length:195 start_codon:yes stop_codon:yes gene_type:complete
VRYELPELDRDELIIVHAALHLLYCQYMQGREVFGPNGRILGPIDFKKLLHLQEPLEEMLDAPS